MEKQSIFFNSVKALFILFIGLIALLFLAGFLAYTGISNIYVVSVVLLLCAV
jgi:cell division protein FtsB